jgi:hypothetical protein
MAFNTSRQLVLDIKAQDRLREWFAQRGSNANVIIKCIGLGDSDVDYELSDQVDKIQVLSAPYNVTHKLIFEGQASNLTGKITSYLRYVDSTGQISSLYGYPPSTSFTTGIFPPLVTNGFDQDQITFSGTAREGFIVFLQTLPDNFTEPDPNNPSQVLPLRFVEEYDIVLENLPATNLITNATNATPVVISTTTPINVADEFQLLASDQIAITGIAGNLAANGLYYVNPTSANTFELYQDAALTIPVAGNGFYAGGGEVVKWFVSIDTVDGSLLISRGAFALLGNTDGKIKIRGLLTGITKEITFNY